MYGRCINRIKLPAGAGSEGLGFIEGQGAHIKAYSGALLFLQLELDKRGLRGQVEAVELDIAARDGDRFNRLIHRLRADRLDLDRLFVAQKRRDGAGDGVGPGIPRDT
jgi:hypothetical protein